MFFCRRCFPEVFVGLQQGIFQKLAPLVIFQGYRLGALLTQNSCDRTRNGREEVSSRLCRVSFSVSPQYISIEKLDNSLCIFALASPIDTSKQATVGGSSARFSAIPFYIVCCSALLAQLWSAQSSVSGKWVRQNILPRWCPAASHRLCAIQIGHVQQNPARKPR